jgi:parallel beta-helix repeat protein
VIYLFNHIEYTRTVIKRTRTAMNNKGNSIKFWNILFVLSYFLANPAFSINYIVSSNADAGANTLRQAIINANGSAGADNISFNFAGVTTITLVTCLPQITGQTTIDGYTNPGASAGNLMIEVISPTGCNGFDFAVGSSGSTISGLVISGGTTGIYLRNSNNHVIKGNYLGTNIAGTAIATNRLQDCIQLNTSNFSTVGGTGGQIDRNIISGATQDGIRITASTDAIIINNHIGVDVTGNVNLGNTQHGIECYNNSHNIRVGGTTTNESNVVSANHANGIYINQSRSPVVKGNIVGMGRDGTTKLGNTQTGINIQNTGVGPAQVGGITLAERNYSSCNGAFGVYFSHADNSVIEGNWLGVDKATGNLDYGNYDAAITVVNTADVRVGGSVAGSGNICSGSGNPGGGADGISIWSTSPRAIIKGNIIGLGADGTTPLQNYGHGIELLTSPDAVIGGTTLLERNLIANSFNLGIQLGTSPRTVIYNNYIGTDASGTIDNGGSQTGINVFTSDGVIIGGSAANANIVAYNNGSAGIVINADSKYVTMTYNSIFCNMGPGIDLITGSNENVPAPVILSSTSGSVNGTGIDGNIIHVYRNVRSDGGVKCNCEGEIYIGTTIVSGSVWTLPHGLGLSVADAGAVTATQTTPLGSTSEFSNCFSLPMPIELLSFNAIRTGKNSAEITWSTAMEKNNLYFSVQRSVDRLTFENIATVAGAMNSNTLHNYAVTDPDLPETAIVYYRLVQVDVNGASSTSNIISLNLSNQELNLIPEADGFSLLYAGSKTAPAYYEVYSVTGVTVANGSFTMSAEHMRERVHLNLSRAIYIVKVVQGSNYIQSKIYISE